LQRQNDLHVFLTLFVYQPLIVRVSPRFIRISSGEQHQNDFSSSL